MFRLLHAAFDEPRWEIADASVLHVKERFDDT